jgi:hypothetical protein
LAKKDRSCHDGTSEISGFAQHRNTRDCTKSRAKNCAKDAKGCAKALVAA